MNIGLRDELAAIVRESQPAPVIEITPSGELLPQEAMELARFYARATGSQRAALDAVRAAFAGV